VQSPRPEGGRTPAAVVPEAVAATQPLLEAMARSLCGNPAEAQDLLQDTMERALRHRVKLDTFPNTRAWLCAVLHRLFVDRCRRRKHEVGGALEDVADRVPAAAPDPVPFWARVTEEQLDRALEKLGQELRAAFDLHREGRSYAEIAHRLAIPMATVGSRLLRARRRLRDVLVAELNSEGAP
jgi:RNA polymerase sigma-70 factor (ECF subfamily)